MFKAACGIFVFASLASPLGWAADTTSADAPDWKKDTLTGDWGGARASLFARGVTLDLVLKADVLSNVAGGIKDGTKYMDNWDVKLRIDAEKLLGWTGTTAYFHVISNHGGKLNANNVGSFMGVDNIEVNT